MSIPQSNVAAAIIGLVGEPGGEVSLEFRAEDDISRARVAAEAAERRDRGETVFLRTHDERLLLSICDELWWRKDGEAVVKGDPREVYGRYLSDVAATLRASGAGRSALLQPSMRRGDGRAELVAIETLGADAESTMVPTMVWRSGEAVAIKVTVQFKAAVADPVVGVMIRTRIGMEVYGTNTELEQMKLGPVAAGDMRTVRFAFGCWLCPNDYTITAASHDPDGVWHDWLEDAVAIQVIDDRYTAGVANLRAQVTAE